MTAIARIITIITTVAVMIIAGLHIADTAGRIAKKHNSRTAEIMAAMEK